MFYALNQNTYDCLNKENSIPDASSREGSPASQEYHNTAITLKMIEQHLVSEYLDLPFVSHKSDVLKLKYIYILHWADLITTFYL